MELARDMGVPFAVVVNRAGIGDDRVQEYCRAEDITLLPELPYSWEAARAVSGGGLLVREIPAMQEAYARLLAAVLDRATEVKP